MIRMNENYNKLEASYLFVNISKKVQEFQQNNPDKKIIKMGIGDVTKALPAACIEAFHKAVDEMAVDQSFHGYGPERGYSFLREAIAENDFASRKVDIKADEIYISDGSKCDTGNFQELFDNNTIVAVPDPVYPVYVDTNVMAGRTGMSVNGRYEGLVYLNATKENGFVPELPEGPVDLIYLCFPNNPTGTTATKEQLKAWVDYAKKNKALILFDAAYVGFIQNPDIPHSIFEIPGAKEVAVEFRSFSKTAGFTGTRCAYTVIPDECSIWDAEGKKHSLAPLWNRRHSTKFNGVSYPVQKAAAAIYTKEGQSQTKALTNYYLKNASLIREGMTALGYQCFGGIDSPYVWVYTAKDSWESFSDLLNKAAVVVTPGSGFGQCGQGYIRISAFNSHENIIEALDRLKKVMIQD